MQRAAAVSLRTLTRWVSMSALLSGHAQRIGAVHVSRRYRIAERSMSVVTSHVMEQYVARSYIEHYLGLVSCI